MTDSIRSHLQEILNRHQPPTNSNYCAFCEIRNPCPDSAAAQAALDLLNANRWSPFTTDELRDISRGDLDRDLYAEVRSEIEKRNEPVA